MFVYVPVIRDIYPPRQFENSRAFFRKPIGYVHDFDYDDLEIKSGCSNGSNFS